MLRGYISDGIFTFKGIQYATAERFMPPRPVAKWEGVQQVLTDRVTCPIDATAFPDPEREFMSEHVYGVESEDCLRLHTLDGGATMIFDNVSAVRRHHDRELMQLLALPAR